MKQFKIVEDVWVVEENTSLAELAIREGATIQAPKGKKVTMTIGGVGTKFSRAPIRGI